MSINPLVHEIAWTLFDLGMTSGACAGALRPVVEAALHQTGIPLDNGPTLPYDPAFIDPNSHSFIILTESLVCVTVIATRLLVEKTGNFLAGEVFAPPAQARRAIGPALEAAAEPSPTRTIASRAFSHVLGIGTQAALVAKGSGVPGFFVRMTQHLKALPCWVLTEVGERMTEPCTSWDDMSHVAEQRFVDPGTVTKVVEVASNSLVWKVIVPVGIATFVMRQIPTCVPSVASRCSQLAGSITSWCSGTFSSLRDRWCGARQEAGSPEERESLV